MTSISNNYDYVTSGNIAVPKVDTTTVSVSNTSSQALPIVNKDKQDLLKRLGIDENTYIQIINDNPDFPGLGFEKQQEIISKYINNSAAKLSDENEALEIEQPVSKTAFDKKTYNKLTTGSDKVNACLAEAAKNIYIYGAKDKYIGNVSLPAHSEEEWNNLSPETKQAEINKIKEFINKNDALGLKEKFNAKKDNVKSGLADYAMAIIQTANSQKNGEGVSLIDFMLETSDAQRAGLVYEYLDNIPEDDRNNIETQIINYSDQLASAALEAVNQKNKEMGMEPVAGQFEGRDMAAINDHLKYYNLNSDELIYNALKDKENKTPEEEKAFAKMYKVYGTSAGQAIIKRQKIANLKTLQTEFAALEAKSKTQDLEPEELQKYNILTKTLNTKESKELLKEVDCLPEPKNDYEKSVAADIAAINKDNKAIVSDDIRLLKTLESIEKKTQGMSEIEKEKYITNFLKFNMSADNVAIFAKYAQKYENLWENEELLLETSVNIDKANDSQFAAASRARVSASKSKNRHKHQNAIACSETINQTLASEKCSKAEWNARKALNAEVNANQMHYASESEAATVLNGTTDVNTTITDAKVQLEAQKQVENSESANDDVHIHTVSKAKDFHKDNQVPVLDISTSKSAKATAYAAENDILRDLDVSNQSEAYSLIQSRINEQYKGADVDKYSSALANQIKNCDASVQSELIDKVYASGNQKAIETVTNNIDAMPACLQKAETTRALFETALKNNPEIYSELSGVSGSDQNLSIKDKIASGYKLSSKELSSLSLSEKREYIINYFNKLPMTDKVKLLRSIPNGSMQKTIYKMVATHYELLFEELISDADTAKKIKSMNLSEAINNKIDALVRRKQYSESGFATMAREENKKQSQLNYTTTPEGFNSKEVYKKDKQGNLLA